jgi:outer membrane protein OmpA-like peptidoglycan-associated protein
MNTFLKPLHRNTLIAAGVSFALFAGCSAAPAKPDGADNARNKLTQLQSNPELATRAPVAMKEAEAAVQAAEQPQKKKNKALGDHLVFVADHKVDIAQAQAEAHLAVDQRKGLAEQRDAMRLQSRTQEADTANRTAAVAVADAGVQKRNADSARDATADAQREAHDLQVQIDELKAKKTDRGLVVTLGDVLFASGTANLNAGASTNLNKLVAFLNKYPERNSLIEGYTDSVGTDEFNQGLSERRADAVKAYLTRQGIAATRLTASGKGEASPVGDNTSAAGRQQNRRVEVIIENQLVSAR